jgi:hypothetical protein
MSQVQPRLIGVMRHASAYDDADPCSKLEDRKHGLAVMTREGRTFLLQAGYALAETLDHESQTRHALPNGPPAQQTTDSATVPREIQIKLLHPGTVVTKRTAELLREGLERYSSPWIQTPLVLDADITRVEGLLISNAGGRKDTTLIDSAIDEMKRQKCCLVLAIMHDPAASWLLHRLVKPEEPDKWISVKALFSDSKLKTWLHSSHQLPMRNGELIMAKRAGKTYDPVWAISPSSDQLIEDVRDKVSKKMDTAKQLGAFATALFAFAVTGVLDRRPQGLLELMAWSGVGVLGLAVVAYFITLFRYDSLLMPRQLWASTQPDDPLSSRLGVFARPPSSAIWVLYQNMMLIWLRGFTVACGLVGLGGVLVVISISDPTGRRGWSLVISILVAAVYASAKLWQRSRPELGVND